MSSNRIREDYRRHSLLAAEHKGSFWGRVWKNKKLIHEREGKSVDGLIIELRDFVDDLLDQSATRRAATPSEEEYVKAFQCILGDLNDNYIAMLKAHYCAEDQTITATELAEAAGYKDYGAANLHYGTIGKHLFEELPVVLPKRADGTRIYTFALATEGERSGDEANWQWKLRPEVTFALERLGLVT